MDTIKKIVRKSNLHNPESVKEDISYWMSRTAEERIAAVDYLREQYYGSAARLQRIARVVQRA